MKDKTAAGRDRVTLAPRHQLQKDAGGNHILTSPSGPVRLNASAAAILELCNGTLTRKEIVSRIVGAEDEVLADEVREFLESASRRGWIVEE